MNFIIKKYQDKFPGMEKALDLSDEEKKIDSTLRVINMSRRTIKGEMSR